MPGKTALASDSSRAKSEDRAAVIPTAFGLLAIVADGVGGRSGGAAAADAVVTAAGQLAGVSKPPDPRTWMTWCRQLDREMAANPTIGETTAVVVVLSPHGISGVAVGDSEAWLVDDSGSKELSSGSQRKPWLGSGMALPVVFAGPPNGTLLLATDGLLKYTSRENWGEILRAGELSPVPAKLIESVRYPSGQLPDDVAVIVARWFS